MLGVAGVDYAKTLRIEQRRERGQHLDIASVAARAVVMNNPRRARHFMIHGCRLLNKHVDEDGHKVEQAKHQRHAPSELKAAAPGAAGEGVID